MPPSPPFRRVLVANRGEIAIRVCRSLRELGITPVVVYSEADREATHVLQAEHAVCIGPAPARESYLVIDKLVAVAKEHDCAAIHPGYGFLSENSAFPRAIRAAGLVFIGPGPEAMEALGSKQRAKGVAIAAGVPVVPGFNEDHGDDARLQVEAARIGVPLLIKASAGGGGKGMRLVTDLAEFREALAMARREAKAAFGDDTMLLEKRVFPARHVEIQIFGDAHGNAIALGERECSVQRRHQKVLEEAPSTAIGQELRKRMCDAAVALAKQVGYTNAGTVEFLVDPQGNFFFLEVNTRLQVEHPVTEFVTGLDLVQLQVRIAAGEKLSDLLAGKDLTPRGWALEARICAESPEHGFLPAAGKLRVVREPCGPGIRVDSGVHEGGEVPVHYDSMLAKIVVHAQDRLSACERMARALAQTSYLGIPTNVDFLRRIVEDEDFRAGKLRTDFLDSRPELVAGPQDPPGDEVYAAALLGQIFCATRSDSGRAVQGSAAATNRIWGELGALRLWEDEA